MNHLPKSILRNSQPFQRGPSSNTHNPFQSKNSSQTPSSSFPLQTAAMFDSPHNDFTMFDCLHYPFANQLTPQIALVKTVVKRNLDSRQLQKLINLCHPNIIGLRKIVKGKDQKITKSEDQKRVKDREHRVFKSKEDLKVATHYQLFYEPIPFSLPYLISNPQQHPTLFQEVISLNIRSILRSVVQYLQECRVYYSVAIQHIGVSPDGTIKVYVPPPIVFESSFRQDIYKQVNQIVAEWENIQQAFAQHVSSKHTQKNNYNHHNQNNYCQLRENEVRKEIQLQPPRLQLHSEMQFDLSLQSSTIQKELQELLADQTSTPTASQHHILVKHPQQSSCQQKRVGQQSQVATKARHQVVDHMQKLGEQIRFIRQKIREKHGRLLPSKEQGNRLVATNQQGKRLLASKEQGKRVSCNLKETQKQKQQNMCPKTHQNTDREKQHTDRQMQQNKDRQILKRNKQRKMQQNKQRQMQRNKQRQMQQNKQRQMQQNTNDKKFHSNIYARIQHNKLEQNQKNKCVQILKNTFGQMQQNINCINIYSTAVPYPSSNHYNHANRIDPHFYADHEEDYSQDTYDIEFEAQFDQEPVTVAPKFRQTLLASNQRHQMLHQAFQQQRNSAYHRQQNNVQNSAYHRQQVIKEQKKHNREHYQQNRKEHYQQNVFGLKHQGRVGVRQQSKPLCTRHFTQSLGPMQFTPLLDHLNKQQASKVDKPYQQEAVAVNHSRGKCEGGVLNHLRGDQTRINESLKNETKKQHRSWRSAAALLKSASLAENNKVKQQNIKEEMLKKLTKLAGPKAESELAVKVRQALQKTRQAIAMLNRVKDAKKKHRLCASLESL